MTFDLATTPIFDCDAHVVEPPNLWTSRLAAKWSDRAPRVVWDEEGGESRWRVGSLLLSGVGEFAIGGWPEPFPSHPATFEETHPGTWNAEARLQCMDEWGIRA